MKPISPASAGKEWIQAKLNRSYVVTAIETQGRFFMGNGKEFTPSYYVMFSRDSGATWNTWRDVRGGQVSIASLYVCVCLQAAREMIDLI